MKIVIDVPDYVVEKEMYICHFKAWGETLESTFDKAEPLSEVLDKISAEIDEAYREAEKEHCDLAYLDGLASVGEILEKYKKEGAE